MTNELSQHGIGIIGLQDVRGDVNITQILGKSAEFKDLLNQLETQRDLFDYVPEDQTEKRLRISQTIAQLEAQIAQFKQDVTKLAQEFNRIEINTDRLGRAKAHFEQGEIAAARAVFDSEREQMQDENNRLAREKDRYEQDVLPKLKHNSEEFYMRARLERFAYDNPNWLEDTCEYFERSIRAFITEDNVFHYATFLQKQNLHDHAETYYKKYLNEFAHENADRAKTLNNLAILHADQNDLEDAEAEFLEALAIYQQLITTDVSTYLPDLAATLTNLANLHRRKEQFSLAVGECDEALRHRRHLAEINPSSYMSDLAITLNISASIHNANKDIRQAEAMYEESLAIYRRLAIHNPSVHKPNLAMLLNNLAIVHKEKNELEKSEAEIAESVNIYRKLAAVNPAVYLPELAKTLNNIAVLHKAKNDLQKAECEYMEALEIRRKLAAVNPAAYLPELAKTLNNIAVLHKAKNDLQKAECEYMEALEIRRKLAAVNPAAYLPELAMTLINVAIYHLHPVPNRDLSISHALEAMVILLPIVEGAPYTQIYLQTAKNILQGWGVDTKDIQSLLINAGI